MAARALREAFEQEGVPSVITDLLDFSSDLFKWSYSDVYAFVSEHSHLACRIMYELTNKNREESAILRLYEKISLENVKKFMRFITENEPDRCICTHFFPLNVISRMKAAGLYAGRLYTVITDYGLHKMWVNEHVDRYFIPSEMVREGLLESGVPDGKIVMSGIPVLPKFARLGNIRRSFSGRRLRVLFIASSIYNTLVVGILRELKHTGVSLDVTLVTGRNHDLADDLRRFSCGPNLSLNVLGFVENLDQFMATHDVLITKPGGLTVSEALCASIPMVLVNPIPKQETNNSAYLQSKGAGVLARTPADIGRLFVCFHEDRQLLVDMELASGSIAFPNAACTVVAEVLGQS